MCACVCVCVCVCVCSRTHVSARMCYRFLKLEEENPKKLPLDLRC